MRGLINFIIEVAQALIIGSLFFGLLIYWLFRWTIMNIEEFEVMLKKHDWSFEYSDDFQCWIEGTKQLVEIKKAIIILGTDAQKLFDQYMNKRI